jgi:catechol-2,3-dioxygenase
VRIHHLAFRTADLPRLEGFYRDAVGLEVLRRDGTRSAWLDAGGAILMLEQGSDDEPAIDRRSLELTCFGIEPGEHLAIVSRLEAAGVGIEGRTAYSLYFRDPDGRRIGISSYPTELESASQAE